VSPLPPILAAIGTTPLVELRRVLPAGSVRLVASLLLLPTILSAQDSVTATSGNRRVIAEIRRHYQGTERHLNRMDVDSFELVGFSVEGGEGFSFRDGLGIRKIVAHHYGESFRSKEEFYFSRGLLYFALVVLEQYTEPLSGVVGGTLEHRFYFSNDSIVRIVRNQRPPADSLDMSWRDPDITELRRKAALFLNCADAGRTGETSCIPND
jgi:hypothetical protein